MKNHLKEMNASLSAPGGMALFFASQSENRCGRLGVMRCGNVFLMIGMAVMMHETPCPAAETGDSTVNWTHEYVPDVMPSQARPAWRKLVADGTTVVQDGVLTITCALKGGEAWQIDGKEGSSIWDGSRPSTVEFTVRVREMVQGAIQGAGCVCIADGTKYYSYELKDLNLHTYRIVLREGRAEVYQDGDPQPAMFLKGQPFRPDTPENQRNYLCFGEASNGEGGTTEWTVIRWTNEGAFPPGQPSSSK